MSAGACADPFPSEKKDSGYPQCAVVSPWKVPDRYFDANRRAMIDRARLIPYIYTQARLSFESGVSIIQPLYYHFPHHEHAYAADYMGNFPQYMFGSDMMISPVLVKAGASDTSEVVTWLPPGLWFSVNDGMLRDGGPMGKLLKQKLTLEEWGVYVRAGAIIPRIPVVTGDTEGLAQREYSTLVVSVYPGGTHGKSKVYEDDGLTMDHLNGDYRWTTAEYTRTTFFYKSLTFTVQSEGKYANMLDTRDIQLRLVGSAPPIHVYVNGKVVEMTNKYHHKHHHKKHHKKHAETAHTWHFDGDSDLAVVINAYDVQCNEQLRVYVVYTELFQADADTHTHTDTHTDTHVDTHVRIEAEAEGAGVGTHAQTHSGQADADAQTHAHTRTRAAHARARDTATDTAEDDNAMDTDTLNGLIGAVAKANLVKDAFDDERTTPGSTVVKAQASLIQLASLGIALEYAAAKGPKEFYKLAKGAKELLEKAKKEVLEIPNADANRKQFGVEVLNEIFM
ncbi:hypothetical protein SARC_12658 [Sphaeroforma arctica JP610]|uniref:Uncharacterized protein n=1 Tax=Sphaeroforma arctica JP610 TaxID=667725 RepID=A0A0L0FFI1_9EUKA|nr:hypothetical protein SARC_12658 [Sphaeroforma arctica JP610]KNC74803.1 hypothetical protein SARC_12658 [Sphaeroforma arctica JP610]|eukprot:XP_014148705.1 hypothetical protein SARC_12658 [Sphaeroforma arctica JP610]